MKRVSRDGSKLQDYPPKKNSPQDKPFTVIPSQINVQDSEGNTALMRACHAEQFDTMQSVLAVKANPDIQNTHGNTALILTVAQPCRDPIITAHMVAALIDARANLDLYNKLNYTALMMAGKNGYLIPVKILLKAGADLSHQREELVVIEQGKKAFMPQNAIDIARSRYAHSTGHFSKQAYFTIWNSLQLRQNKLADQKEHKEQQATFIENQNRLTQTFKDILGSRTLPSRPICLVTQYHGIESDQSNLPAS
jgi:hypothetical protein